MRVIRFLASVIVAAVLVASAGMAMGSFAVTEAVSQEAIEKAITETGAIDELTNNILAQNTVNLGGQYGQTMKEILKSDAMTEFFTAYTAGALQAKVLGEEGTAGSSYYEEIGSDDLYQAFSSGTDQCLAKGSISMNEGERTIFDGALKTAMPMLAEGINYVLTQMNLTSFVDEDMQQQIEIAHEITSDRFRYGTIGLGALAALLLFLLRWNRHTGFVWCGVCLLLVAAMFYIFAMMLEGTVESSSSFIALSSRMLYIMVAYGLQKIAIIGGGAGVLCFPACPIAKLIFRKR